MANADLIPAADDVLADKYRIERELGRGGMGVVLAATHLQLEERVAIKFLLPELSNDPALVARFLREAKADILQATFNSREWIEARTGGRGGAGTYYLAVD